ncbi:lipopolysaccharide biosynthesis protein [Bradyrhizobium sp. WSM1253]|uniref:lipopolysaccharide biosynthesis protein n=1 Tax=Bradyrhizobium sp. WSM1253 TaxID=319003 RepID=UPI0012F4EED5|nr:oligosaccharide flippase family protein [Bradyrhizobium sp. WSM1253]
MSALSSMIARGTAIGANLLLIPILLNHLGLEQFGAWTAIASLTLFLSFADLGIGNGIINDISAAAGKEDRLGIRRSITNAYFVLATVALILLILYSLALLAGASLSPIGSSNQAVNIEIQHAFKCFLILFLLNMPLALIQKIQIGFQTSFVASLWQIASTIASLFGIVVSLHNGSTLPDIVIIYMAAPLFTNVLNTVFFFCYAGAPYRPSILLVGRSKLLESLQIGSMFLSIQVMSALVYNSDAVLISHSLGSSSVPIYSVPERLMSLPSIILSMALVPLWPAMSEALARGEAAWVGITLRKALLIACLSSATCGLMLIAAMPLILQAWVSGKVDPPLSLLVGLAVWKTIESASYAYNAYLNSARQYRFQTITSVLLTLSAFPAKLLAYGHFGVAGGVWALSACYVICPGIPVILKLRKVLRSQMVKDTRT